MIGTHPALVGLIDVCARVKERLQGVAMAVTCSEMHGGGAVLLLRRAVHATGQELQHAHLRVGHVAAISGTNLFLSVDLGAVGDDGARACRRLRWHRLPR